MEGRIIRDGMLTLCEIFDYYSCHSIHRICVNPVSVTLNKQSNINALIIYQVITSWLAYI